ncbi:MAG: phosphonate ABC transporter ATP-binding protein, partial [Okeania sp. SIO2D1]|nr:phosphonate ABC transporter ATP-binding protein [Okeania sp. SIO2D1]
DEPIASLDPQRSREIMDLLHQLSEEMGKTLVTSLHDIEFARSHFARIIGLKEGKILFDCAVESLTPEILQQLYEV